MHAQTALHANRRRRLAGHRAVLLPVVLALAACGDDGSPGGASGAETTTVAVDTTAPTSDRTDPDEAAAPTVPSPSSGGTQEELVATVRAGIERFVEGDGTGLYELLSAGCAPDTPVDDFLGRIGSEAARLGVVTVAAIDVTEFTPVRSVATPVVTVDPPLDGDLPFPLAGPVVWVYEEGAWRSTACEVHHGFNPDPSEIGTPVTDLPGPMELGDLHLDVVAVLADPPDAEHSPEWVVTVQVANAGSDAVDLDQEVLCADGTAASFGIAVHDGEYHGRFAPGDDRVIVAEVHMDGDCDDAALRFAFEDGTEPHVDIPLPVHG